MNIKHIKGQTPFSIAFALLLSTQAFLIINFIVSLDFFGTITRSISLAIMILVFKVMSSYMFEEKRVEKNKFVAIIILLLILSVLSIFIGLGYQLVNAFDMGSYAEGIEIFAWLVRFMINIVMLIITIILGIYSLVKKEKINIAVLIVFGIILYGMGMLGNLISFQWQYMWALQIFANLFRSFILPIGFLYLFAIAFATKEYKKGRVIALILLIAINTFLKISSFVFAFNNSSTIKVFTEMMLIVAAMLLIIGMIRSLIVKKEIIKPVSEQVTNQVNENQINESEKVGV